VSFSFDNVYDASVVIMNGAFNTIRKTLRDGAIMSLRMNNVFPKGNARSKSRSSLGNNDPITEINKFGYNPALDRRVHLKFTTDTWGTQFFANIFYMIDNQANVDLYRADINRIDTKDKLCLKESDEIKKEEDFNHVETSYKRLR
jgi:hypothetical protein